MAGACAWMAGEVEQLTLVMVHTGRAFRSCRHQQTEKGQSPVSDDAGGLRARAAWEVED